MTMTLQSAIREKAAENQAERLEAYREMVTRAASGDEADPETFLHVAESAGVDAETAAKHLDVLSERVEAARTIAAVDSPEAIRARSDADAESKQLRLEYVALQRELEARIEDAKTAFQRAANLANSLRSRANTAKLDASRSLFHSSDPEIRGEIETLQREVRDLGEESNGLRSAFSISELDRYDAAKAKSPGDRNQDDIEAIKRFGQIIDVFRYRRDAEQVAKRRAEIPGEIEAKEQRIAELQKRLLDPIAGMRWD